MTEMTVTQAIAEGYEKFLYSDEGFQTLHDLSEVSPEDFERGIELVSKDAQYCSISKEDLAELIADHMQVNHYDETRDDTNEVENIVKALDFTQTAKMINDALTAWPYYKTTGIKLSKF